MAQWRQSRPTAHGECTWKWNCSAGMSIWFDAAMGHDQYRGRSAPKVGPVGRDGVTGELVSPARIVPARHVASREHHDGARTACHKTRIGTEQLHSGLGRQWAASNPGADMVFDRMPCKFCASPGWGAVRVWVGRLGCLKKATTWDRSAALAQKNGLPLSSLHAHCDCLAHEPCASVVKARCQCCCSISRAKLRSITCIVAYHAEPAK